VLHPILLGLIIGAADGAIAWLAVRRERNEWLRSSLFVPVAMFASIPVVIAAVALLRPEIDGILDARLWMIFAGVLAGLLPFAALTVYGIPRPEEKPK